MRESITSGSVFAGIGGFDIGFERAGMVCRWQVEIDEYCNKVLHKKWGGVRRHRDARTFPPDDESNWYVDVLCGGDPCQENSKARQGTGLEQPSLGGDFVRIVDAVRPRVVVRENPAAVRSDAPWPWWRMRSSLESIGYVVMPFRLRACCLGADHQRDRMFLLAERADAVQTRLEGDVLEKLERAKRRESARNTTRQNRRHPTPRISGSFDGIPHRTHRIRACGNAVDVRVAEWIGRTLVTSMS